MSDVHQFCPACGAETRNNPRYPAYICNDCVPKAAASDGRLVAFNNCNLRDCPAGMSVVAHFVDSGQAFPSDRCFIGGIECQAKEARFGGVVIQPVSVWIETGQGPNFTSG